MMHVKSPFYNEAKILGDYLRTKHLPKAASLFEEHNICWMYWNIETTELLQYLYENEDKECQIEEEIIREFEDAQGKKCGSSCQHKSRHISTEIKIVNDPVHGLIDLHPLCTAIVDTPQFQRLRYLMHLGSTHFVYPSATHTRFEHSLGVCHLAGRLVRALKEKHPEISITDNDVLCVQIAGLCHDLGHGPFSHLFEEKFMRRVRPSKKWKHEDTSVKLLQHMFKDPQNSLVTLFRHYNLTKEDYIFIEEQINPPKSVSMGNSRTFKGRREDKHFLYEIVSNFRNGMDVDKWDYLARDCYHIGFNFDRGFDFNRFIHFARVNDNENGEKQICVRDKEAYNVYEMFQMRHTLHRRVYNHKVCNAIDLMIVEAMTIANSIYERENSKRLAFADCVDDMKAFTHFNDNIFHKILEDDDPDMAPARELLMCIQRRHLFPCIFESTPMDSGTYKQKPPDEEAKEDFLKSLKEEEKKVLGSCFFVQVLSLNFEDKGRNETNGDPVRNMRFYTKAEPTKSIPYPAYKVSKMAPRSNFGEQIVRVFTNFSVNENQTILLNKAIKNFRKKQQKKRRKIQAKGLQNATPRA